MQGKKILTLLIHAFIGWALCAATMGIFVVVLLINKSLAMFASPLGTWIPFALIFTSTLVTGTLLWRKRLGKVIS